MICFEVRVNGKVLCTAGVGDLGVLTTILTWVKRSPHRKPEGVGEEEWCKEDLYLSVSGSTPTSTDVESDDYFDWIGSQTISPGDEITVRVLVPGECDPPRSIERKRRCPRPENKSETNEGMATEEN
jgi:hypothetical protein